MNIQQIMKQAQQMQKKLEENQNNLKNKIFEGTSGNGAIKISISGDFKAKSIQIDNSLINIEEKDLLEDLIITAINNTTDKINSETEATLSSATNGMKLPF